MDRGARQATVHGSQTVRHDGAQGYMYIFIYNMWVYIDIFSSNVLLGIRSKSSKRKKKGKIKYQKWEWVGERE